MSFLESFDASRRIVAAKSGIFHSIHAQHHLVLDHKHVGQRGPSLELGKYMALRWYALRSWSMSSHMPRDQPQFFGMSLNARFCASLHPVAMIHSTGFCVPWPWPSSRDRDIETIWCGEFERLQSLVAKDGGQLSLESAHPIGQFPLKIIEDGLTATEAEIDVKTARYLPR
jgi:hypothetical protein